MNLEEVIRNLIDFIGNTQFEGLQKHAFTFACIEADYLGISVDDVQSYRRLHRLRREFTIREALEYVELTYVPDIDIENSYNLTFPNEEAIRQCVIEKYEKR